MTTVNESSSVREPSDAPGFSDAFEPSSVLESSDICESRGISEADNVRLAAALLTRCADRGYYLALAESLTGGLLAAALVSVPGASKVFLGSAVTYNLGAKERLLAVSHDVLVKEGAVDRRVAAQMAEGAARLYGATIFSATEVRHDVPNVLALSTTGVAGPDSDGYKPVGLVYLGLKLPGLPPQVKRLQLRGDRSAIRRAAVNQALQLALAALAS